MSSDRQATRVLPMTLKAVKAYYEPKFQAVPPSNLLCFVARLVRSEPNLVFSDETATLTHAGPLQLKNQELVIGRYYECTGTLFNYDMSYAFRIASVRAVDSNFIAIHMIRVMKREFGTRIEKPISYSEESVVISRSASEDLYVKMKEWCLSRTEFRATQLRNAFSRETTALFDAALERLEQEEFIGNMGDHYVTI